MASLLVLIGAERLSRIGLSIPPAAVADPEHRLYALLAAEGSDSAHSRYNALIRQLVSVERAAECAASAALTNAHTAPRPDPSR